MKKFLAIILALAMILAFTACGESKTTSAAPEATATPEATAAPTEEPAVTEEPSADVMTHAEYNDAETDTEVTIETYVQSKQTWWDNQVTVYAQSEDGAYFIYNMSCSEEDYDKLVPGQKIKVTGYKSEWSGEVEIADATFELEEGSYIAEPLDVTDLLGTEELAAHQNEYVSFTGMVVESVSYKNGEPGDDIYVTLSKDGTAYDFCDEAYLWTTTPDSDVYATIGELKPGDIVNVEGFLYWYYNANPHITGIEVTGSVNAKSEGVMTYAEYTEAAVDDPVVIETYVQNTQTWWEDACSIYSQDADGGYFIYNTACTEEAYSTLTPGTKIRVTGYKSEWSGEVEIVDSTFEVVDDGMSYIAPALNVTGELDHLEDYMNRYVRFDEMTVEAISYKNGEPGDDIYVTMSKDGTNYEFCVEAYCATTTPDSELYAQIGELKEGDTVDVLGYLYWYEGADTHITGLVFG